MIRRVFVEEKVATNYAPFSMEDIQSATEEGRRAERERIIRVLENLVIDSEGYFNVDKAIALIKGESK